jgi:hypothetical protein
MWRGGCLALVMLLAGCSSANIAANEAAVQQFFATAEADIALVFSAVESECSAVNTLLADATVAACLFNTNAKTQTTVAQVVAASQAACASATSSQSANALQSILSAAQAAYSAAKSVQTTGTCS